jgi:hypothetical protein
MCNTFTYGAGGDGTSYAAAMTTGVAALRLQHRRAELSRAYTEPWQRVAAFRLLARNFARVPGVTVNYQLLWQPGSFGTWILNADEPLNAPLPRISQTDREPTP